MCVYELRCDDDHFVFYNNNNNNNNNNDNNNNNNNRRMNLQKVYICARTFKAKNRDECERTDEPGAGKRSFPRIRKIVLKASYIVYTQIQNNNIIVDPEYA